MKVNLLYNDFSKEVEINENDKIGIIQEKFLSLCSLVIYNIEHIKVFIGNEDYILGINDALFDVTLKQLLSKFLINTEDNKVDQSLEETISESAESIEKTSIILDLKFIIYDRKRDEYGNVIKENIIIDNYNKWYQLYQTELYINNIDSIYNFNNISNNNDINNINLLNQTIIPVISDNYYATFTSSISRLNRLARLTRLNYLARHLNEIDNEQNSSEESIENSTEDSHPENFLLDISPISNQMTDSNISGYLNPFDLPVSGGSLEGLSVSGTAEQILQESAIIDLNENIDNINYIIRSRVFRDGPDSLKTDQSLADQSLADQSLADQSLADQSLADQENQEINMSIPDLSHISSSGVSDELELSDESTETFPQTIINRVIRSNSDSSRSIILRPRLDVNMDPFVSFNRIDDQEIIPGNFRISGRSSESTDPSTNLNNILENIFQNFNNNLNNNLNTNLNNDYLLFTNLTNNNNVESFASSRLQRLHFRDEPSRDPLNHNFQNIFQNILENNAEINSDEYIDLPPLLIPNNENLYEDIIIGLSEEQFDKLDCSEFSFEELECNQCFICMEEYIEKEEIIKLKCNHIFHKDCIKKWLCCESNKCPVCRIEVDQGIPLNIKL